MKGALRLQTPTNVRFNGPLFHRMQRLGQRYGISTSEMVRQAVAAKLSEWEENGIRLVEISPESGREN